MYAVIDIETTGLSPKCDRIIELAIVCLDMDGNMEWEWCSLINPERDTGSGLAVRVHQIYSRDVAGAPTFADFAGYIARILSGRVIIAHNARFDLNMLTAEYARLRHQVPDLVQIDTARIAQQAGFRPYSLDACCDALGITMEGAHHALADARATARLAQQLVDFSSPAAREEIEAGTRPLHPWPDLPLVEHEPVTRAILPARKRSSRTAAKVRDAGRVADGRVADASETPVVETFSLDREKPESKYLAAVEWVLEDREISTEQRQALEELRSELSLSDEQVREVHLTFIRGLAGSMWADGTISAHEQFDLAIVGKALGVSPEGVAYARDNPIGLDLVNEDYILKPKARVVFTGEMSVARSEWIDRAKSAGLRVTGSVSGRTDFLVVPYGETGSSKSVKARERGVRVVSEQRFRRMIERLERSLSDRE